MDDKFLSYYERELTFIREMGASFARKYPKLAGRLLLEEDKCEDPHTERLIEAFAFISGRIHKKIDDDFPEITESLLSILYPHYVNPIPSMSIVQFSPIMANISNVGYHLPRQSKLFSKPVDGHPCEFNTCYPVSFWPVDMVHAELVDPRRQQGKIHHVLHLRLQTKNKIDISGLGWTFLRFFLNGPSQHVYHLYELLMNNVSSIELEALDHNGKKATITLPADSLRPVGFAPDEHLFPYSSRSHPAYLYLFEYFCFPEKFLFIDLQHLDRIKNQLKGEVLDIRINLDRPAKTNLVVNRETFSLFSAPVVNLFRKVAEPIRVDHFSTEYRVVADVRRQTATEIYSVESVTASLGVGSKSKIAYTPYYSLRHHLGDGEGKGKGKGRHAFWHVHRRESGRSDDQGTEVFLSFTDQHLRPDSPDAEILTLHVHCTNRDLPVRLPFGNRSGDFSLEQAAPVQSVICLVKPTATHRPALGGALQWRLISHLSLNYLSLVEGGEESLKEILKLYNFDNSLTTNQQINGIASVQSTYVTRRIRRSFCRGIKTTVTLDEEKFVGSGLFLFASVLEQFFGQYVSVNSFSQLEIKNLQQKEVLKLWEPRNGTQILL